MLKRFERFSLVISEIHKHLVKISSDEMKKHGLQGPSARPLLFLHKSGSFTAADLARELDKNKADISRILGELEKKGLIEKEESSTNYRVTLKLTPLGERTAIALETAVVNAVAAASQGVSDEDRDVLYASLDLISKNLQTISNEGIPL